MLFFLFLYFRFSCDSLSFLWDFIDFFYFHQLKNHVRYIIVFRCEIRTSVCQMRTKFFFIRERNIRNKTHIHLAKKQTFELKIVSLAWESSNRNRWMLFVFWIRYRSRLSVEYIQVFFYSLIIESSLLKSRLLSQSRISRLTNSTSLFFERSSFNIVDLFINDQFSF